MCRGIPIEAVMIFEKPIPIASPTPPPAAITIAPIRPQTNTDGDEVELRVIVRWSGASSLLVSSGSSSDLRDDDDKHEHERRGSFAISGLNGLKIDADGEISGHIKAGVTAVTVFEVTVTFTWHGATATQQIIWTVKPALSHKGAKG